VHDVFEFVFAKHAVIDEDAGQLPADGPVQQHGGHGRVHSAAQAQDDLILADLGFQFGHGGIDKGGGAPVLMAAADIDHKVLEQQRTLQGMDYFGMELDAPQRLVGSLECCVADTVGRGDGLEAGR